MKKINFLIMILCIILMQNIRSQDSTASTAIPIDTSWKTGGILALTFAQAYYDNWASGGEQSYSLNSRCNLFANYIKGKISWKNSLDLAYGFTWQESTDFRKNNDLIELNSGFGLKASGKWNYSAQLNVKSQFSKGFDYTVNPFDTISDFLSPLYMNFAVGMDYVPNASLSVFLSPVNLKIIYVNDTAFSLRNSVKTGEHVRTEFGAIARIKYQKDLTKTIHLLSKMDLFYNYLDPPKYPYFSWEVLLTMNVWKALSVNLNTQLVYDDNYKTLKSDGTYGDAKIQFKEVFGLGLALNF